MISRNLALPLLAAALAACGAARDLSEGTAAGAAACSNCHGDAARSGSALSRAAPDTGAHLAHLDGGVACGSCHEVPGAPVHADGQVKIAFAGIAVADGAQPSFASGTCSGVYCHGATLGAGGGGASPVSWSGPALGCSGCHAAPPPSHAAGSTDCSVCHPGTVKPDGSIDRAGGLHVNGKPDRGAGHPAGWAEPGPHGTAAKKDLASCQACHGIALDGGAVGVSCATCHTGGAAWISNCTFCHGAKSATYGDADLAKAAPPRGTNGETLASDPAVGAHQRHLAGGALGPAVACAECHAVPGDLSHLDGEAAVTFGPAARRAGADPSWTGASCASTYCHGATLKGGTQKAPSWTGGASQAACGTCHGAPPPPPHTASTSCGGCHDGYDTGTVNAALHMNGNVERPAASHPPGWGNPDQHGYAVNRSGLSSCKGCHGTGLTGGTGPSCGSCHPGGGTAWATSCTFCHGNPASGRASPPVDTQGGSATASVSVGAHAVHVGTALMTPPACTECHPGRAGSNVITDAAHVDGDGVAEVTLGALARTGGAPATYSRTSSTAATCASTYCHGRFPGGAGSGLGVTKGWTVIATATCGSCHPAPPSSGRHAKSAHRSCGDCHPGYTASAANPATHLNGTKQVGNRVTRFDPATRSCTNTCHGNETW